MTQAGKDEALQSGGNIKVLPTLPPSRSSISTFKQKNLESPKSPALGNAGRPHPILEQTVMKTASVQTSH